MTPKPIAWSFFMPRKGDAMSCKKKAIVPVFKARIDDPKSYPFEKDCPHCGEGIVERGGARVDVYSDESCNDELFLDGEGDLILESCGNLIAKKENLEDLFLMLGVFLGYDLTP